MTGLSFLFILGRACKFILEFIGWVAVNWGQAGGKQGDFPGNVLLLEEQKKRAVIILFSFLVPSPIQSHSCDNISLRGYLVDLFFFFLAAFLKPPVKEENSNFPNQR